MNEKYSDLSELVSAYRNEDIAIPPEGRFYFRVGKDFVHGVVHPGWDEDGEELGDPEYIFTYRGRPQSFTVKLLEILGLPGEEE